MSYGPARDERKEWGVENESKNERKEERNGERKEKEKTESKVFGTEDAAQW